MYDSPVMNEFYHLFHRAMFLKSLKDQLSFKCHNGVFLLLGIIGNKRQKVKSQVCINGC
jgi:hypothetical protein